MKVSILLFSLIILSCSSKERKSEENKAQTEINNSELTLGQVKDSLLIARPKSKLNENLQSSLLAELYLKRLVSQQNNKILFQLPFNLHGLDCGAPDCYSTDIIFEIPSTEPIEFPENINLKLYERGCIEHEKSLNSIFKLKEKTTEYVNYFSEKLKSNLIIKRNGQLYYYPHQQENSVSVNAVEKMFAENEFEKENAIAPFRSTIMEKIK